MSEITLSALVLNYNHGKYLTKALSAILEQSRQPDEIIIIDDASTDGSMAVIEKFRSNHPDIKVKRNERNKGVVFNMNYLLENATSRYVYFAASDDMVLPGLFEKSLSLLEQYPHAGICSSRAKIINEQDDHLINIPGTVPVKEMSYLTANDVYLKLRKYDPWLMGNTAIYKRESLLSIGGFQDSLQAYCDGFAMLVIALKEGACFIPETLAAWRRMDSGYSSVINQDYDKSLLLIRNALQLMRTTYKELFSPSFVDYWERTRICMLHIRMLKFRNQEIKLNRESEQKDKIGAGRYLRVFKNITFQIFFMTMASYFVFRYRLPIFRLAKNKLKQMIGN